MKRCADFDVAISLRSTGALDASEAAELEAHLAACPACRVEAARADEVIALATLPPPDEAEGRALRDLPARTLGALHASERRVGLGKRVVAGVAAAAALAVVVLAPAILGAPRRAPSQAAAPDAAATAVATSAQAAFEAEASWRAPDLDALWDDARVVELDGLDSAADAADAALAALDY